LGLQQRANRFDGRTDVIADHNARGEGHVWRGQGLTQQIPQFSLGLRGVNIQIPQVLIAGQKPPYLRAITVNQQQPMPLSQCTQRRRKVGNALSFRPIGYVVRRADAVTAKR
jgi:hypothetical protein